MAVFFFKFEARIFNRYLLSQGPQGSSGESPLPILGKGVKGMVDEPLGAGKAPCGLSAPAEHRGPGVSCQHQGQAVLSHDPWGWTSFPGDHLESRGGPGR